ncbi:MAG: DUF6737 family protein [Xenococcaceae cyanobacterium]
MLLVSGSWVLTKTVWVTIFVSLPILAWWTYFLVLWPRLIRESGILAPEHQSAEDSSASQKNNHQQDQSI